MVQGERSATQSRQSIEAGDSEWGGCHSGRSVSAKSEYVADIPTIIAASGLAKPGKTVVLEFEAPEAGSYYFICTYPGHWEKMTGVFKVTAAA